MSEPSNNISSHSAAAELENIKLELAKEELKKVQLEIENLKPKRKLNDEIARYIPLITAVLSIVGFLWGVVLFLNQQERDRRTREEERISRDQVQYRNSYEQLLQFSSNPNISVQRVMFLRDDIDHLIDSLYPPDNPATMERNKTERDRLKNNIYGLITKECDFTQTRHVQLDIAALQAWTDYEKDVKETPNKVLINKYIRAIQFLHARDPRYIESVTYDPQIGYSETQAPSEPLSNSFGSLAEGFKLHLQLLSKEDKERSIEAFARVTKNPTLTADLFQSESTDLFN
jgi:hypothetical protein